MCRGQAEHTEEAELKRSDTAEPTPGQPRSEPILLTHLPCWLLAAGEKQAGRFRSTFRQQRTTAKVTVHVTVIIITRGPH